jgi:hypothetical protein
VHILPRTLRATPTPVVEAFSVRDCMRACMHGLRVHGLRMHGLRVHGLRMHGLRVHGLRVHGLAPSARADP